MKTFQIAIALLCMIPCALLADIELFDSTGKETAFIDDELRVYLWDGTPVAHLKKESYDDEVHVYGYNGKHLGWYEGGAIIDHKGLIVGAQSRLFTKPPVAKSFPRLAKLPPLEALEQLAPLKPLVKMKWSDTDFKVFLLLGKKR